MPKGFIRFGIAISSSVFAIAIAFFLVDVALSLVLLPFVIAAIATAVIAGFAPSIVVALSAAGFAWLQSPIPGALERGAPAAAVTSAALLIVSFVASRIRRKHPDDKKKLATPPAVTPQTHVRPPKAPSDKANEFRPDMPFQQRPESKPNPDETFFPLPATNSPDFAPVKAKSAESFELADTSPPVKAPIEQKPEPPIDRPTQPSGTLRQTPDENFLPLPGTKPSGFALETRKDVKSFERADAVEENVVANVPLWQELNVASDTPAPPDLPSLTGPPETATINEPVATTISAYSASSTAIPLPQSGSKSELLFSSAQSRETAPPFQAAPPLPIDDWTREPSFPEASSRGPHAPSRASGREEERSLRAEKAAIAAHPAKLPPFDPIESTPRKFYSLTCFVCQKSFNGFEAAWCDCPGRERSLLCPNCGRCSCKAPATYRQKLWLNAPSELLTARKRDEATAAAALPEHTRPLVLVVEDESDMLAIVSLLIRSLGYGLLVARDGEEGLRLGKLHRPDLVLSDALLPKMDGREMCKLLKEDSALGSVKTVVMTGVYTYNKYKSEALSAFKVDAYIFKPINMDELKATISKLLPTPVNDQGVAPGS